MECDSPEGKSVVVSEVEEEEEGAAGVRRLAPQPPAEVLQLRLLQGEQRLTLHLHAWLLRPCHPSPVKT